MRSILFTVLLFISFMGCSGNDHLDEMIIDPKEQWSATLRGDGEVLGAYPDLFSNYWEYSIAGMTPTDYKDDEGEPIDKVTDPDKQLAHRALGDYGPYGFKYAAEDFLRDDFKEE